MTWAFAAFAAAWTAAAALTLVDSGGLTLRAVIAAPIVVATGWVLAHRGDTPGFVRGALGWTVIGALALGAAVVIASQPVVAAALPALAVSAAITTRFPVASLFVLFLLTGFFGTLAAFTGISAPPVVDLILGGLWVGALWLRLAHPGQRPVWLWPAVVLLAVYIGLTLFWVVISPDVAVALRSFRLSAWYMMAVLLVAYAPWADRERRLRIARAFAVVTLLVGSYGTFRYVFGQSTTELTYAFTQSTNEVVGSSLRLVGSFPGGRMLAIWTASAIPFCVGVALTSRGRWRVLSLAAALTCALPLYASLARAGLVAVAAAAVLVLALHHAARAFPGVRLGATALAATLTVIVGVAAFNLAFGSKADLERYRALVTAPSQDVAVQARLAKWRAAYKDVRAHPFGQGLGTSGVIHKRFGRFFSISDLEVDNAYLKIALEQGFGGMLLFMLSVGALLVGLARRATATLDPQDAALGIGAAGTLLSMAIFAATISSQEALPALAGWMMVGLGAAPFVTHPSSMAAAPRVGRGRLAGRPQLPHLAGAGGRGAERRSRASHA